MRVACPLDIDVDPQRGLSMRGHALLDGIHFNLLREFTYGRNHARWLVRNDAASGYKYFRWAFTIDPMSCPHPTVGPWRLGKDGIWWARNP
jgi:hypothetical protein